MELLALALVNLVTAGIMYFVFSLRYTRAVKEREPEFLKEQRELVNMEIKTSELFMDFANKKQESIYLLVRRAELLLDELRQMEARLLEEEAAVSKSKRGKKTSRKKSNRKAEPAATAPAAKTGSRSNKKTQQRSAQTTEQDATDKDHRKLADLPVGDEELDPHLQRLFASNNQDRLEMRSLESTEQALRAGMLSPAEQSLAAPAATTGKPGVTAPNAGSRQPGSPAKDSSSWMRWMERLGQGARRVFNIEETISAVPENSLPEAPSSMGSNGSSNRRSESELPAFELPTEAEIEQIEAARTARTRPAPPRGGTATGAAGQDSLAISPEARKEQESAGQTGGSIARMAQQKDPKARASGASMIAGGPSKESVSGKASPRRDLHQTQASGDAMQPIGTDLSGILESHGESDLLAHPPDGRLAGQTTSQNARKEIVRTLLGSGHSPAEIAATTGIGLAEIELIARVPGNFMRPRSNRLNQDAVPARYPGANA